MPTVTPGAILPAIPYPVPVPPPTGLGMSRVSVTLDAAWLPYVIGCCKVLTANSTFDPPDPAPALAAIKSAYDLLGDLSNPVPVVTSAQICEGCDCGCEDCMQLRFNCGTLEQFDCITQAWVPVQAVGSCADNPAPGAGATQPPPGQTSANICFKADASALTPLPWTVNTGDILDFTSVAGAGTDGVGSQWYCPDGSIFFAGACAGGGATNSGDPLNTTNHMALLLKIGTSYYPLPTGNFTVPSGVTNSQVYLQVNTAAIANARGQYSLCVQKTNSATPTWHAHFDFTTSANPFQALFGSTPSGSWAPTAGYQSANWQDPDYVTGLNIESTIDSCTVTRATFTGDTTLGSVPGPALGNGAQALKLNSTYYHTIPFSSISNGAQSYDTGLIGPVSGVTQLQLLSLACDNAGTTSYCGGSSDLKTADVYGTGIAPSQFTPYLVP